MPKGRSTRPSIGSGRGRTFAVVIVVPTSRLLGAIVMGLDPAVTVTVEQNDHVSSLSYPPIHLFSLHPDLQGTDLTYWKRATLLYPLEPGWETHSLHPDLQGTRKRATLLYLLEPGWEAPARALQALRGSDHTSVAVWLSVDTTILPGSPHRSSPPSSIPGSEATPPTSSSLGNMDLPALICALLLGLTLTASASQPLPSECHPGISGGTHPYCLHQPFHPPERVWHCGSTVSPHRVRLL